jgi:Permeases of the drug/metabolite transporter (DMT) superfamily
MSVPAAYMGIVMIWSTTPLAIKWSSEGAGFLFAVTARMALGTVLCLLLLRVLGIAVPWHREARRAYVAAALGIYAAMLCTYWGAQYIPSGLISVLYGLTPLFTGVMAAWWLNERSLSPLRVFGVLLGIAGLALIFLAGRALEHIAWQGIVAVLCGVLLQAASAVWVKRTGVDLHPMALNGGALLVALLAYLLTWGLFDGEWPAQMDGRTLGAIAYLGVLGTVVGFNLYFFVLKRLSAGALSVITLITPVLALLLGNWVNAEVVETRVWQGTACILVGLLIYQWGGHVVRRLRRG